MADDEVERLLIYGRTFQEWSAEARRRYLIDVEEELSEDEDFVRSVKEKLFDAAITHALHHANLCRRFGEAVSRDSVYAFIADLLDEKIADSDKSEDGFDADAALDVLSEIIKNRSEYSLD